LLIDTQWLTHLDGKASSPIYTFPRLDVRFDDLLLTRRSVLIGQDIFTYIIIKEMTDSGTGYRSEVSSERSYTTVTNLLEFVTWRLHRRIYCTDQHEFSPSSPIVTPVTTSHLRPDIDNSVRVYEINLRYEKETDLLILGERFLQYLGHFALGDPTLSRILFRRKDDNCISYSGSAVANSRSLTNR
jgi:hypothetical protein